MNLLNPSSGSTSKLTTHLFNHLRNQPDLQPVYVDCRFTYSLLHKPAGPEVSRMTYMFEDEPNSVTDPSIFLHLTKKFKLITKPAIPVVTAMFIYSPGHKAYRLHNIFLQGQIDPDEKVGKKTSNSAKLSRSNHGNVGKTRSEEFKKYCRERITQWWADKKAAKNA